MQKELWEKDELCPVRKSLIKEDRAEEIAREIYSWAESAMFDISNGDEILADDSWEDPDCLQDIFADRIHDEATIHIHKLGIDREANDFNSVYVAICKAMKTQFRYHASLVKVMDALIQRHS